MYAALRALPTTEGRALTAGIPEQHEHVELAEPSSEIGVRNVEYNPGMRRRHLLETPDGDVTYG